MLREGGEEARMSWVLDGSRAAGFLEPKQTCRVPLLLSPSPDLRWHEEAMS